MIKATYTKEITDLIVKIEEKRRNFSTFSIPINFYINLD